MSDIREPAVAGLFYPAGTQELQQVIQHFLDEVPDRDQPRPKAIVVPHAGYMYSGSTAALAYASLKHASHDIKRVILLGPSHRVGFRGIAFCSSDSYRTPLGEVKVDQSSFVAISDLPDVGLLDRAHAQEHSLEVQLPFLQSVLEDFTLVPLVVGDVDYEAITRVLERLWGGPETLIVISSDLSHYHDYATARRIDADTCKAVENYQPEKIGYDQACGRTPLNGLLELAHSKHLEVRTLGLCNSGDTAGDRDRVVGYGAWAFYE